MAIHGKPYRTLGNQERISHHKRRWRPSIRAFATGSKMSWYATQTAADDQLLAGRTILYDLTDLQLLQQTAERDDCRLPISSPLLLAKSKQTAQQKPHKIRTTRVVQNLSLSLLDPRCIQMLHVRDKLCTIKTSKGSSTGRVAIVQFEAILVIGSPGMTG